MISIKNLSLQLGTQRILDECSYEFPQQQISVLLGPSGCGKSTILKCVAGLITPQSGELNLSSKKISFVFQEPRLLPWLSISENILLPLQLTSPGRILPDTKTWLDMVGLKNAGHLFPHQLSGGMKMRVSMARALISEPEILLLDEPFAALDEALRFSLQELLLKIQAEKKLTILFVTHSFSEAVFLGDHLFLMNAKGGKQVYSQTNLMPSHPRSRKSEAYMNAVDFWSQKLRGKGENDKSI